MNTHAALMAARLGVCAVVVASSIVVAPQRAAAAAPSFRFTGSGSGHGIGLSQYGAKGFAEHGKTGGWIATYYYPGTSLGSATARTIKVNMDEGANYNKASSSYNAGYRRTSWRVRPGYAGGKIRINDGSELPDTTYTLTPVSVSGVWKVRVKNAAGSTIGTYDSGVKIAGSGGSPALVQIIDAAGPFNHTYLRVRGSLRVLVNQTALKNSSGTTTLAAGKLKVLNYLSMANYLYGVVPRESPASWHIEALKAQAITARSYAQTSPDELYCTTMSQVYNGHSRGDRAKPTAHEYTSSNSAVDSTEGQFVKYGSTVVRTYFHNSSGGYTANIEDVWGGGAQPYYKGVPDPYAKSTFDPWKPVTIDGMNLAKRLAPKMSGEPSGAGSSVYVKSLSVSRAYPSEFVRSVDVAWSNGAVTKGVSATSFRQIIEDVSYELGLYKTSSGAVLDPPLSTRFFVNVPFDRIAYGDRYDTSAAISNAAYPTGSTVKAAVIVNGTDAKFADALTASALAGTVGGPVLLVPGGSVPVSVVNEIKRLKGLGLTKLYIVGGELSVAPSLVSYLDTLVTDVERLSGNATYGTDRYGTAAVVAMKMKSLGADTTKVMVASGTKWPDAAIAAAVAAGAKRPVVLASYSSMPRGSMTVLEDLGATQSFVFGGPASISATAISQLTSATGEAAPAKRFGMTGSRYDVAVEAAKWAVSSLGYSLSTVYVASGEVFPDSVTGGVLAGKNKRPLLMTDGQVPSRATAEYLQTNRAAIDKVIIVGGKATVTDACGSSLASYAR